MKDKNKEEEIKELLAKANHERQELLKILGGSEEQEEAFLKLLLQIQKLHNFLVEIARCQSKNKEIPNRVRRGFLRVRKSLVKELGSEEEVQRWLDQCREVFCA